MDILKPFERALYSTRQGARVAWYMAHYAAAQRQERKVKKPSETSSKQTQQNRPMPTRARIWKDMARLFQDDLNNIEGAIYPMPWREDGSLLSRITRSRKYFSDLPDVAERRAEKRFDDFSNQDALKDKPAYYTRNFHFQTDGYLSEDSAALYDLQVETLFSGTANAMRRQAIVPIANYLKGKDQRKVKLLDVACGTGRFLRSLLEAYPRLNCTGLDLSKDYLAEADRFLSHRRSVSLIEANAEAIPANDKTYDLVSCIYLFHELPPKIREKVAAEISRVLKPGGQFVFVDSLQYGDIDGGYDGLLDMFPEKFHEPFYATYAKTDLSALMAKQGLRLKSEKPIFLSKLMVFEKA